MSPISNLLSYKLQRKASEQQVNVFNRARLNGQQEILLRSIIKEFYFSSKLTVVFTSIVNARLQGIDVQTHARPASFIPPDPIIFYAVAAGQTTCFGQYQLIDVLQDYYSRLSFARAFSELPAAKPGQTDARHPELLQIVDIWRRVCDLANLVAHQLYEVEDVSGLNQSHPLLSLHELIKAAQRGQMPLVRNDGLVAIPGWLDQRRDKRKALGWKIWMTTDGRRERATLQDISMGGVGLADCPPLTIGALVIVELPDSRALTGIVTWSQANRLGARFLSPLSLNDPVLTTSATA